MPGETAPYAVSMVPHHSSFLLLHALFSLADRSVETLKILFCTTLLDMFMYMVRDWSTLVDAIENGVVPGFENIEHVREHLEASTDLPFPSHCMSNQSCSGTYMRTLSVLPSYATSDRLLIPSDGQSVSGQI